MLLEVELAFLWLCFVHLALVQIKSNYIMFILWFVCVVYCLRFLFCSVLNAGIVGKRGEASGGGYLLRGMEQAGKLFFWFCFFTF